MSYPNSYYGAQYVQPADYSYQRHLEIDEYSPGTPRYLDDRHDDQDFGSYNGHSAYGNSYEAHSAYESSRRHETPYPAYIAPARTGYGPADRRDSYSTSHTSTSGSHMSRHSSKSGKDMDQRSAALNPGCRKANVCRRHGRTSPGRDGRQHFCDHFDCVDNGQPQKYFSRKADVDRHKRSTHEDPTIDCPFKVCSRKGKNGFTRQDHCTEHQRQYHGSQVPKRNGGGKSRHSRHE